jgi:VCBS repeat-containing protein
VTETISYRVTDADGDTSTASITITVVGQNDGATISGVSTGSAVEDNGTVVGGTVTVSDVDNGEAIFQTPNGLNGTYGSFTFNANSGAWAYDLNDAAANVQALRAGETVQDRITVTSLDGTASQQILVTITGTNDAPVVAAALVAAVNEGEALQTINLLAGASDVDTGETATLSVARVRP